MKKKFNRTVIKVIAIAAFIFVAVLGAFILVILPGFSNTRPEYAQVEGNMQTVSITIEPKEYTPIVVQKGIPVKFIIEANPSNLTSCNSILTIPEFGIEKELKPGENIIEFTPQEIGTIPYSCKMGMVKSKIKVVDDAAKS